MPRLIDLSGQRFGRLVVLRRAENAYTSAGIQRTCWAVRCDCGVETVVRGAQLQSGRTRSCGCLHHDSVVENGRSNRRETVGYKQAHYRLRVTQGSASSQLCVDGCGRFGHEWSYVGGCPDELVEHRLAFCLHPEHYQPRCAPCHNAYDSHRRDVLGRWAS